MSWGTFFGTLSDTLQEKGQEAALSEINQALASRYGSLDHIPAQNAAAADIQQTYDAFYASGPHSDSQFRQFEQEILNIAQIFYNYALTFNTARAIRGAQEIMAWAKQIVSGAEAQRMGTAQWPRAITSLSNSFSQIPSWVLPVGIGAFFLLRRKR